MVCWLQQKYELNDLRYSLAIDVIAVIGVDLLILIVEYSATPYQLIAVNLPCFASAVNVSVVTKIEIEVIDSEAHHLDIEAYVI